MKSKKLTIIAIALVAFAMLSRLVSHPMNFTPITALILFSVYAFEGKWKILIPAIAILFSDILIQITAGNGFHNGSWLIYTAYAVIGGIAYLMIKNGSMLRVVGTATVSSVSFFIITNFALFYPEITQTNELQGYAHNMAGIIGSYTAGIPFFRNMLLGDLLYSFIIFGVYFIIRQSVKSPATN